LAPHARDAGVGREKVGSRDLAQRDDHLRPYQLDLAMQERLAGERLAGLRVAVAGRAAFHAICDVDVRAALETDGRQHVVEEPPRLPDEGLALRVFLRPRSLADEHPVRALVADAEYGLRAPLVQRAVLAPGH